MLPLHKAWRTLMKKKTRQYKTPNAMQFEIFYSLNEKFLCTNFYTQFYFIMYSLVI